MPRIRTLIVDDEPLARRAVRALLDTQPDIEIMAEAGHGAEAVEQLRRQRVDLLFLDVQMPGVDGFGVLASIDQATAPLVIFLTAFDTYAIEAFEQSAFDYLLKPVDPVRFDRALQRARVRLQERADGRIGRDIARLLGERLSTVVDEASQRMERITFRDGARLIVVDADEVEWVGAEDDYVRVHTAKKNWLVRETLSSVEQRLGQTMFVRIHRSTIVNVTGIRELVQSASHDAVVVLRNGERLRVSRRYREAIAARLGG